MRFLTMGIHAEGGHSVRNLTYAIWAYVATLMGLLSVGVGFLFGWVGDSPTPGLFAVVIGLVNIYGVLALARLRRRARSALRVLDSADVTTRARPLTPALVFALLGLSSGLVIEDAGIGIIFGIVGFVVGRISAWPLTGRRRPSA